MIPERRNKVKLLLLFDIGGRWTPISASARSCSRRRAPSSASLVLLLPQLPLRELWRTIAAHVDTFSTAQLLHTYPPDYKIIFVGDGSMSPYEIAYPGGSVEHWNEEAGQVWIQRMADTYRSMVWLNPVPERHWSYHAVGSSPAAAFQQSHVPLDPGRLDSAMRELKTKKIGGTQMKTGRDRPISEERGRGVSLRLPGQPSDRGLRGGRHRPIIVRQERIGLHMADAHVAAQQGRKMGVFCMQSGRARRTPMAASPSVRRGRCRCS